MTTQDPVDVAASNLDIIFDEETENLRTCTPVHVTIPNVSLPAVTIEGQAAVPDLLPDGSPSLPSLLSERPVWYPGGGGFYMRWPLAVGDVALGVVSDRSLAAWSLTRTPGPTASPTFPHYHNLSDTQVLPVTDTPGVPEADPGLASDMVIGGPAGVAVRVGTDGTVTISKTAAPAATITIDVAGGITLEVQGGQTVKIGDVSAEPLVIASALMSAMTSALAAGVATPPTPMAGNNGSLAMTNFQTAWNAAIGSTPLGTTKAWGV